MIKITENKNELKDPLDQMSKQQSVALNTQFFKFFITIYGGCIMFLALS